MAVRQHIVPALAAALLAACIQRSQGDRETDVTDPEVQVLLSVAEKVDWNALGFSPLPTSGSIRFFKKSEYTARDANDAGLLADREGGSRTWFFNRAGDGYRLACAGESVHGRRTWQRPDVNGGKPYSEMLQIDYVAQDPGVCGTGLKPGVHGTYRGPNGIEEVAPTEIARLRTQLQDHSR